MISTSVSSYGVLIKNTVCGEVEKAVEQIINLGFAVVGSGYSDSRLTAISASFDRVHEEYVRHYGEKRLRSIDEYNGIRLPLAFDKSYIQLAMNEVVLGVVSKLIQGKFILNQQNGIINPPGEKYNQGAWHRDLPYQHFVSSRPIAINALYCVDEFTRENGATHVLPASHRQEAFPSNEFVLNNQMQISAPAGAFVLIDCMTYHRGGFNTTLKARRAVNHVYTIPHIRQQIDIPAIVGDEITDDSVAQLLGYSYTLPRSLDDFLKSRKR